jgi:hypothetical protein
MTGPSVPVPAQCPIPQGRRRSACSRAAPRLRRSRPWWSCSPPGRRRPLRRQCRSGPVPNGQRDPGCYASRSGTARAAGVPAPCRASRRSRWRAGHRRQGSWPSLSTMIAERGEEHAGYHVGGVRPAQAPRSAAVDLIRVPAENHGRQLGITEASAGPPARHSSCAGPPCRDAFTLYLAGPAVYLAGPAVRFRIITGRAGRPGAGGAAISH